MLDRLEHNCFVNRNRSLSCHYELTDAGEENLNYVLVIRKKIMQDCFIQMEPNELDPFIQSLEKLASIAQLMEIKEIIE